MTAKLTDKDIERARELVRICEEQKRKFYAYAPDSEVLELFPKLVAAFIELRDRSATSESRALAAAWQATRQAHEALESIRPAGGWPHG